MSHIYVAHCFLRVTGNYFHIRFSSFRQYFSHHSSKFARSRGDLEQFCSLIVFWRQGTNITEKKLDGLFLILIPVYLSRITIHLLWTDLLCHKCPPCRFAFCLAVGIGKWKNVVETSLRSMAVLLSRAQERRSREIRARSARERAAKPREKVKTSFRPNLLAVSLP